MRAHKYASENAGRPELVANAIRRYNLTREMAFGAAMGHRKIWEALFEGMPMTAMIHNLGTLTRLGITAPVSDAARRVAEPVDDADALRKVRVHPIAILSALMTYRQRRERQASTWPFHHGPRFSCRFSLGPASSP